MDLYQLIQITDNHLLLLANTDTITENFTFLYLRKKFTTCSLCTPGGEERLRCGEPRWMI